MEEKNTLPQMPKHGANLDALIPSLAAFGERVARGEATTDEIKYMSKVADLAKFQGDEETRRRLAYVRSQLW
ncbi:MAG: hypothetical protein HFJ73_01570 [Eggerthellaceae bacterium]|nr:hypothetical protein [Eggerthellaceae bacterium]